MSAVEAPSAVAARAAGLLDVLRRHHADLLVSVTAYGQGLDGLAGRQALEVLVVLQQCRARTLMRSAGEIGQLGRQGVEPLFMSAELLPASLDVFPLELLHMRSHYAVLAGDDVLAGLEFEPGPLRLQIEEEARSIQSAFRQEIARHGHQPRAMVTAIAQTSAALVRVWRGLVHLRGADAPADVGALLRSVCETCEFDLGVLERSRAIELGAAAPTPPELWDRVAELDDFLRTLAAAVDQMVTS